MTDVGHNGQLKSIVERIERLESEKTDTLEYISDVYKEAKGNGFDVKALRAVVRLRKEEADKRNEHLRMIDIYMHALGMLADTPLGKAAVDREFADTKVTISSGDKSVETTAGALEKAAHSLRR
jgi:uncharacterized protein (UPF0335 family)